MDASDAEVIRESVRARPDGFGVIFDRHGRAVYRYVRRRVGDELAADVTAEAYAQAFRDRARFDGRGDSALPWLLGIATNLIRMHQRSEARKWQALTRAAGREDAFAAADEIEARLDAEAVGPVLADALATLPAKQRDVLLLHAWGELTAAEIAVALSVPAGTVRSDLHRARAFLTARLRTHAPDLVLEQEAQR